MSALLPSTAKPVTVRVVLPFLVAGERVEAGTLYTCPQPFAAQLRAANKAVLATEAEIAAAAAKKAAPAAPSTKKD